MLSNQLVVSFEELFNIINWAALKGKFLKEDWKEYAKTTIRHIVAGLSLKSNRHCKAAFHLIKKDF
jgi:L-ribulose-5-phosphate 3-epimerase UlaE